MKKLLKIITGFFLCIITTTAFALELTEAVELALKNDTTFQAANASHMATIESSSQNKAAVLPQIDFNAFVQDSRTETDTQGLPIENVDKNTNGYSININQVIYNKTVFSELEQGDAITAKARADLESARQNVIIRTAEAYFNILIAIDTLETARAEKKAIAKQLEQSKERYNVGISAITDVKEQQASHDIAVADEIIAINKLSNSREALRIIINIEPKDLMVARKSIPLLIPEPNDIKDWQDTAIRNNFTLLSAKYAVVSAQSAYNASKGGHYPTLSLDATYGVINSDRQVASPESESIDTKVTLSLNIPIYSGGYTNSTIRQKSSELSLAKSLYEKEKRHTISSARNAYLNLQADIATVNARKQVVISTQASLDATLAGYNVGTRTNVDVLLSQRLLYSSQRDYSEARYTYLINTLTLKRITGTLNIDDIYKINKLLIPRIKKILKIFN